MTQGSDYEQRMMLKERETRCDLEKVCEELNELRGRVRQLEDLVNKLANKVGEAPKDRWKYWKA